MKRIVNLVLAVGLLIGTANAASAASLGTFIDRYVAPLTGAYYDPYYGYNSNWSGYNPYYGAGYNPYISSYYSPYSPYGPYPAGYFDPYYGYGYNPYYGSSSTGRTIRTLGNLLLNWF